MSAAPEPAANPRRRRWPAGLDESLTRWLPELATRDARFSLITLRHLLRMLALRETRIESPPGANHGQFIVVSPRHGVVIARFGSR